MHAQMLMQQGGPGGIVFSFDPARGGRGKQYPRAAHSKKEERSSLKPYEDSHGIVVL